MAEIKLTSSDLKTEVTLRNWKVEEITYDDLTKDAQELIDTVGSGTLYGPGNFGFKTIYSRKK